MGPWVYKGYKGSPFKGDHVTALRFGGSYFSHKAQGAQPFKKLRDHVKGPGNSPWINFKVGTYPWIEGGRRSETVTKPKKYVC